MIENINKLLDSTVEEDFLIGVELAYTLDYDTFVEIFRNRVDEIILSNIGHKNYFFTRKESMYVVGKYLQDWSGDTGKESVYATKGWIDLTPEYIKNEK